MRAQPLTAPSCRLSCHDGLLPCYPPLPMQTTLCMRLWGTRDTTRTELDSGCAEQQCGRDDCKEATLDGQAP